MIPGIVSHNGDRFVPNAEIGKGAVGDPRPEWRAVVIERSPS